MLRQGNLNPEIEEKLLTLQRYQEKQAKGESFDPTLFESSYSTRGTSRAVTTTGYDDSPEESEESEEELSDDQSAKGGSRRRGANTGDDDDDEWVLDTPRKYIKKADREKIERKKELPYQCPSDLKKIVQPDHKDTKIIVKTTDTGQIRKNIIFCNRIENPNSVQNTFSSVVSGDVEKSPEKALLASKLKIKAAQKLGMTDDQVRHHKLQVIIFFAATYDHHKVFSNVCKLFLNFKFIFKAQLLKHKENLKKMILKKRDTLEKELQNEIQKELSAEMAIHIKNICAKQESIVEPKKEPSKYMKKK